MKRTLANIEFESRREVEELIDIIESYAVTHPEAKDNKVWKRFYDLLDVMDMEW